MRYNNRARLDRAQVHFERRSSANRGSRFDDMERQRNVNMRNDVIRRRLKGRRV